MIPKVTLRQSRDFGQIINDTIVFIVQNWKPLLKVYAVMCGFFMAGNLVFSILFQFRAINVHKQSLNGSGPYLNYGAVGLEYVAVLFFAFMNIVAATLSVSSYIVIYNEKKGEAPLVGEVWVYFKHYFWRVVGSMLLLMLMFVIAMMICLIPAGLVSMVGPVWGGITGIITFTMPFCYFITVISLFFPIMIGENGGFGHSFGRCFTIIKRKWWSTFGVIFVVAILVYSVFLVMAIPSYIISGGSLTFLPYNVSAVTVIIYCIGMSLVQVVNTLPVTATMVAYYSHVEDRDHIGLMDLITAPVSKEGDDLNKDIKTED